MDTNMKVNEKIPSKNRAKKGTAMTQFLFYYIEMIN